MTDFFRSESHIRSMIAACLPEQNSLSGLDALHFSLIQNSSENTQTDSVLHVFFPHAYYARWFRQTGQIEHFEYAARLAFGTELRLIYHDSLPASGKGPAATAEEADSAPADEPESIFGSLPEKRGEHDGEYRFDTFFSGQKNEMAVSMIRRMLDDLTHGSMPYNPLLLRGLPGTGKTHLLKATADSLRRIPALTGQGRIFELSAFDFAGLCRQSPHRQEAARAMLRGAAALCLDDVQLLVRSPQAQEELADLMDILVSKGRPVLCTSSYLSSRQRAELAGADAEASPSEEQLSPALLSRLRRGMVLDLAEADLEVRLSYAQHMLHRLNLQTERETPLFLARHSRQIRHLHGIILRVHAFYRHTGIMPDEEDMEGFFRATGSRDSLTPEAVLSLVAAHFGFSAKDLRGRKRGNQLVEARQIAMFLCRELLGESYPSLGRIFGGKDHSTVMYAVKKIKETQVRNKDMHILVTELTQRCLNRI